MNEREDFLEGFGDAIGVSDSEIIERHYRKFLRDSGMTLAEQIEFESLGYQSGLESGAIYKEDQEPEIEAIKSDDSSDEKIEIEFEGFGREEKDATKPMSPDRRWYVYALWFNGGVVRFGKTLSVRRRVAQYKAQGDIDFDRVTFYGPYTEQGALSFEKGLIEDFNPIKNVQHNSDCKKQK